LHNGKICGTLVDGHSLLIVCCDNSGIHIIATFGVLGTIHKRRRRAAKLRAYYLSSLFHRYGRSVMTQLKVNN